MGKEKPNGGCQPCEVSTGGPGQVDCTPLQEYLTDEEEEILSKLRQLKEEIRKVRHNVQRLEEASKPEPKGQPKNDPSSKRQGRNVSKGTIHGELSASLQELEQLKIAWKEWEDRREEAHRRKMILLGHDSQG